MSSPSLTILQRFKAAEEQYGKIDHVFANAGIAPTINLLEDDLDEEGDLAPPNLRTVDVNLTGCLYTVKLGIHYLRKNSAGGSIVITASASSFMRFPPVDYSVLPLFYLPTIQQLHCCPWFKT
jgi:NAD(P)-dependent dehydrogenase (short-subunit alcohol dehydrogenase family)